MVADPAMERGEGQVGSARRPPKRVQRELEHPPRQGFRRRTRRGSERSRAWWRRCHQCARRPADRFRFPWARYHGRRSLLAVRRLCAGCGRHGSSRRCLHRVQRMAERGGARELGLRARHAAPAAARHRAVAAVAMDRRAAHRVRVGAAVLPTERKPVAMSRRQRSAAFLLLLLLGMAIPGIVKLGGSDKVPRSVAGSSGPKNASACLSSCLHQGGQG
jgi:hypothetical protein